MSWHVGRCLATKRRIRARQLRRAIRLERYRHLPPARLIRLVRDHPVPTGLTARRGGAIGLTDCVIHHQDIRRPLRRPRVVPAERLLPALDFARRAPLLPAAKLTRGLRLVATDAQWSTGDGPEVRGPAETLLMAMVGRAIPLDDLTGDGLATLVDRRATGPKSGAGGPPPELAPRA